MKKKQLISLFLLLFVISCNLIQPKFSSEINKIGKKYKNLLNAESISALPNWSKFDTIETSSVIITILNSANLPKNSDSLDTLSLQIAKDYYTYLINKKDYSEIKIVFKNVEGVPMIANFTTNNFFTYTFDKLENSKDSLK